MASSIDPQAMASNPAIMQAIRGQLEAGNGGGSPSDLLMYYQKMAKMWGLNSPPASDSSSSSGSGQNSGASLSAPPLPPRAPSAASTDHSGKTNIMEFDSHGNYENNESKIELKMIFFILE